LLIALLTALVAMCLALLSQTAGSPALEQLSRNRILRYGATDARGAGAADVRGAGEANAPPPPPPPLGLLVMVLSRASDAAQRRAARVSWMPLRGRSPAVVHAFFTIAEEDAALVHDEAAEHGDIVFVRAPAGYNSLSVFVAAGFRATAAAAAAAGFAWDYILKTDDDVFVRIDVLAWDANCPQHIPLRFDAEDVEAALALKDRKIAELEASLE
jgi:hypothetical protein